MLQKVMALGFCLGALSFADSITIYSNATGMDHSFTGTDSASVNETSQFGGVNGNVSMGGNGTTYSINGSFNAYKNIILPRQDAPQLLGADIHLVLDLPADSGNWVITGYEQAQDDESGPPNLSYYNTINTTLNHTYGAPLTYTRDFSAAVAQMDSFDDIRFSLTFVDPPTEAAATPEPSTFFMMFLPFVFYTFYRWRKSL